MINDIHCYKHITIYNQTLYKLLHCSFPTSTIFPHCVCHCLAASPQQFPAPFPTSWSIPEKRPPAMNRKSHCICSELNLQRSTRLAYDSIELKIMNTVIPPFYQKQGLYAKSMEVSGSHWGLSEAHLSQPPEVTCCVRFSSSSNSHHLFAVAKNFPWHFQSNIYIGTHTNGWNIHV